jgi:hypothetical protein
MENLPEIAHNEYYIFVHAGIDSYKNLEKQPSKHLLWGGDRNPMAYKGMDKVVVHGHMMRPDGPIVDLPNMRVWTDVGTIMTNRHACVCLPEPFDYGYESNNGMDYKIIEVRN